MLIVSLVDAGPLSPPQGPVAPTITALRQTDPRIPITPETVSGSQTARFEIDERGSYYLTGNIVLADDIDAILVTSSDVTIDLNGFTIINLVPGATARAIGAPRFPTAPSRITVYNGSMSGWGSGIDLVDARDCRISDVTISNRTFDGLVVGTGAIVERVTSSFNGFSGIFTSGGGRATFVDCTVEENENVGMQVRGTVERCAARANMSGGFLVDGVARGCVSEGNDQHGFASINRLTVFEGCVSTLQRYGFLLSSGGTARGCSASENAVHGFYTQGFAPASFVDCTSTLNQTDGFHVERDATEPTVFLSCRAAQNGDDGFQLSNGAQAERCTAQGNAFGFFGPGGTRAQVLRDCVAINNTNTGFLINSADAHLSRSVAIVDEAAD